MTMNTSLQGLSRLYANTVLFYIGKKKNPHPKIWRLKGCQNQNQSTKGRQHIKLENLKTRNQNYHFLF